MFKVVYYYDNNRKVAYVSADSLSDAKRILLDQYMVGAVTIIDAMAVNYGAVVYPDGRF